MNPHAGIRGIPLSDGRAQGRTCLAESTAVPDTLGRKVPARDTAAQLRLLERALGETGRQLAASREYVRDNIGRTEAEILGVHLQIVHDPVLRGQLTNAVKRNRRSAVAAVTTVFDAYRLFLEDAGNPYLRERAQDIEDVKQELLAAMGEGSVRRRCPSPAACRDAGQRIIVTDMLTPTMVLAYDRETVRGFIAQRCGPSSHAAILCRALGVPAVSGIPGAVSRFGCGDEVVVDGTAGIVLPHPLAETDALAAAVPDDMPGPVPTGTAPGGMAVYANIASAAETDRNDVQAADGVGLYRTEFEAIAAGGFPGEEEQTALYRRVIDALHPRPVTVRLFDIGGDKPDPERTGPVAAGMAQPPRGTQFLLAHPDVLRTQARAVVRAAAGREVRVLYPMVMDAGQFASARGCFMDATRELGNGCIRHGAMFEVPSACLEAGRILDGADFGSIGTNDLLQYLFGTDREHGLEVFHHLAGHDVFWRMVEEVCAAASERTKPLSVCGELARDQKYLGRFRGLGVHAVSVAPPSVAPVRRFLAGGQPRVQASGSGEGASLEFWTSYLQGR